MNIYDIARANDSISDRLNDQWWERHEAEQRRRDAIRQRATEMAEDPDELESMRSAAILIDAEVELHLPDGTVASLDRAPDLLRDAARSNDTMRANHIAVAAQRAIVDELVAGARYWFDEDDEDDDFEPEAA